MAAIDIQVVTTETNFTHTGNTNWDNTASISSTSIQNATYLVIGSALVGGNATTDNFEFHFREGTTNIDNSYARVDPGSGHTTAQYGQPHFTVSKRAFGGSSNFNHSQKLVSTTTDTVHTTRVNMCMIKVDDADTDTDALHSGDYEYSVDTLQVDAVANTWVDLESIVIGNGSDDYLIVCSCYQKPGAATATFDHKLNIAATDYDELTLKRTSTNQNASSMIMHYLAAPAASTTVKHLFRSNSALGDIQQNAILAIRLNAFDDYAGIRDTTNVPITTADTDFVGATLTHTTDHSSAGTEDWVFLGWSQIALGDNGKRIDNYMDQATVDIAGAHTGTWKKIYDSDSPFATGPYCLIAGRNMANATDVDVDMGHQEEGDVVPNPVIETTSIVGFTKEKAAAVTATALLGAASNNAGF